MIKHALWLLLLSFSIVHADEVKIAVSANFLSTAQTLIPLFEQQTGHKILLSPGSTGKLFAQLANGAPMDIFLAADQLRPSLLEKQGYTASGSRFTYAIGRLAVWSISNAYTSINELTLRNAAFKHLAIANPKTAPYGRAALQVLQSLGLSDQLRPKLVLGENVGQAFQFVATKNAELGFIALAQVLNPNNKIKGVYWEVPAHLYDPIAQDAVLMEEAASKPAALAFIQFLHSQPAREIIINSGYDIPSQTGHPALSNQ